VVIAILCLTIIGVVCADVKSSVGNQDPAGRAIFSMRGNSDTIDKRRRNIVVDHEAIPGFMGAMAMPYPVKTRNLWINFPLESEIPRMLCD